MRYDCRGTREYNMNRNNDRGDSRNSRTQKLVRRNKRRYKIHVIMSAMFLAGFLLAVAFCSLVMSAKKTNASDPDTGGYTQMYKSVMVEQGDCLWDIADRYMSVGYDDKAEYVQAIMELNNMVDSEIHFGDYLCIPYYG